jgi:hypothetical protein
MFEFLFALLVALQLADAWTTYKIIKDGGYEENKLLVKLNEALRTQTNAKWAWLAVAKVGCIALSWWAAMSTTVGWAVILLYVYIVARNAKVVYNIQSIK